MTTDFGQAVRSQGWVSRCVGEVGVKERVRIWGRNREFGWQSDGNHEINVDN